MNPKPCDHQNDTQLKVSTLLSYSGKRRVPLIFQSEVAECGLASLAMISSFHGYQINLSSLRKHLSLTTQGMNLKQLMVIAGDLNFSCRALQCPLNEISQLKLPCILHWNFNHFVVLTGVTKKTIYLNDPALGQRKLTLDQFSDAYTGIALELTPTTFFKKQDVRVMMKMNQLWEKITGLNRAMAGLFSLSVVMHGTALLSPYYMQWVIDNVLLSNDKSLLVVLALGFALLVLIKISVSAFRRWLILRLSSTLNIQMGANLFHHLLRLPMDYFEKRHIGDTVSRFGSLTSIREMLTTGLVEAIVDGLMAVIALIMMYLYSTLLATMVVGVALIILIIQLLFYYPNRQITEESITASAKEGSTFLESIRAIQTIKLFNHETDRQNKWLNCYADVINADIRLGKLTMTEDFLRGLLFGLESILVIYFGALIVMEDHLTVGMLLAFIAYKGQFIASITKFTDNLLSFKLLNLHLERLSDIALQERDRQTTSSPLVPNTLKGQLRLENICFRYSDNTDWVLKDVSFEVKAGESIAITGASGCGKTTLLKIILGLLRPSTGHIYLDGINMNELSLSDYRNHFGTVMQNDTLLSGTLAENITLFDTNFDEHRFNQCCQDACIWEEIQAFPMRFHSLVGDMGSSLSGGQLQRIFLARALYKAPKILCLDESTNQLDQQNEHRIQNNINKLQMTKIVITHKEIILGSVDKIVALSGER